MLNNYRGSESAGRAALDQLALALAGFTGRSAAP